jgi:pyruvate/2-oxoglutarate/acetoin dehydrogenase E1 component
MPEAPRYVDALNRALGDELERDERVVVLGVDVAAGGGVYGVTRGLHARFPDRVRDTPIAEAGVLGAAVGAALRGLRPVVEVMYMDFLTVCLDPIVNQAAKLRYMTGGAAAVPVVFRMQTGAGNSAGAQHSQSLEAILAHVPGLRVYCPADARDAYDLLVAAVRSDDPVCFVENRRLYAREQPGWGREPLPPGRARVARSGGDLTVVAWGRMVSETLRAVEEAGDVDAEVVDLRTLVPLDLETIYESVRRTRRVLVVHEAVESFGPGAEIVARIADELLFELDGRIERLGALPAPVPYSRTLERHVVPSREAIAARMRVVARG